MRGETTEAPRHLFVTREVEIETEIVSVNGEVAKDTEVVGLVRPKQVALAHPCLTVVVIFAIRHQA